MKKRDIIKAAPIILILILLVGCSSMTPRYRLSDEMPLPDEKQAALLQIPTLNILTRFDNTEPAFAVRNSFASQAVVQHKFRETLVPAGPHVIEYLRFYNQNEPLVTALEFKPGRTYRIQTRVMPGGNDKLTIFGWVEELPFLLARRKISPGFNFDQQFQYWYNQDWRIAAAGVARKAGPLPPMDALLGICQERIADIKRVFPDLK